MRIGTNIVSLVTQHQLVNTSKVMARAMERLSSGKRINSAKDDAAGLSVITKLNASVRGLSQTALNINAAVGMIETADSAMSTMLNVVQRMRELSIQASNGTLSSTDRSNMNTEFQQLLAEYQRITTQTEFNGRKLIDGSFSTVNVQIGANRDEQLLLSIGSLQSSAIFTKPVGTGDFATRTSLVVGSTPTQVRAADINNDGNQDILVLDSTGIGMYLGKGDGSFNSRTTLTTTTLSSFDVADFNLDGKIDIAGYSGATIYTYQNQGSGTFTTSSTTTSTGDSVKSMAIGDMDGDGRPDILVDYNNSITTLQTEILPLFAKGDGTFTRGATSTLGSALVGNSIFLGDINNDRKADIAYTSSTTFVVKNGNGNGSFTSTGQQSLTMGTSFNASSAAFADITGDGKADLVTYATRIGVAGQIKAFVNNGTGTLTASTTKQVGSTTAPGLGSLAIGDLNNDGKKDAVITSAGESTLSVFFSVGDGTFISQKTYSTNSGPRTPLLADFNGDGVLDIAEAENGNSTISTFTGNSMQASASTDLTIVTQSQAKAVISILDTAISNILSQKSSLSAIHSRLDFAYEMGEINKENLTGARDQMRDADVTYETAELVRAQILQQSQLAIAAQANLQMQMVLNLLRFND